VIFRRCCRCRAIPANGARIKVTRPITPDSTCRIAPPGVKYRYLCRTCVLELDGWIRMGRPVVEKRG
jgi:hypothetical protein